MKEIVIPFTEYCDEWIKVIQQGLNEHNVIYTESLCINICESLQTTIIKKLREWGYRPNKTRYYRQELVRRLSRHGLSIKVVSNSLLWLYLDNFTDLEDYSKCFDIEIYVKDISLASVSYIFPPIYAGQKSELNKRIEVVKEKQKQNMDISSDIVDILQIMIEGKD